MLLQHTIRYHEAHNWNCLQDPATLTYKTLLQHCKLLEQWCEQFRKALQKGRAELTSLSTASATNTLVQTDSITTQHSCYRCGHNHPRDNYPAYNQWCHNCDRLGHFSHLCRSWSTWYTNSYRHHRYKQRQPGFTSRSSSRSSSTSPRRNKSHSRCRSQSPPHNKRYRRSPTPYKIDSITLPTDNTNSDTDEEQVKPRRRPPPPPSYP